MTDKTPPRDPDFERVERALAACGHSVTVTGRLDSRAPDTQVAPSPPPAHKRTCSGNGPVSECRICNPVPDPVAPDSLVARLRELAGSRSGQSGYHICDEAAIALEQVQVERDDIERTHRSTLAKNRALRDRLERVTQAADAMRQAFHETCDQEGWFEDETITAYDAIRAEKDS